MNELSSNVPSIVFSNVGIRMANLSHTRTPNGSSASFHARPGFIYWTFWRRDLCTLSFGRIFKWKVQMKPDDAVDRQMLAFLRLLNINFNSSFGSIWTFVSIVVWKSASLQPWLFFKTKKKQMTHLNKIFQVQSTLRNPIGCNKTFARPVLFFFVLLFLTLTCWRH